MSCGFLFDNILLNFNHVLYGIGLANTIYRLQGLTSLFVSRAFKQGKLALEKKIKMYLKFIMTTAN